MRTRPFVTRTNTATIEDVEACYELLLNRPPDADGLAHYRRRIDSAHVSVLDVVAEMVGSPEYAVAHQALAEPATITVDAGRFRLHVFSADHAIGHAMAVTGAFEEEVSDTLADLLRPGSVFVDVGANYGWHSLLAASIVGSNGRVIAVEPNPLNTRLLERSAAENGFSNITVATMATSDRDGFGVLETDGSNGRIISLDSLDAGIEDPVACSYVVPLRRLDRIIEGAGNPAVDVIKIDVEGFELATLGGASGLIARCHPVIVSEFFPTALRSTGGVEPESYLNALRDLEYSLSVVGREGKATNAEIAAGLGSNDHVDVVATPV
jgi:FkbM family methyltransferase